jgi:Beta-galactosidase
MSYPPFNPKFPFMLHGGDYNPDQWQHVPGTVDADFKLFQLAGINSVSVAIFAWAALEPEEGRYEFGWLDDIMDRCAKQNMAVVLATPSGAKPNWMALKYPEIRRMSPPSSKDWSTAQPVREPQQRRHNHCFTSPVYREKCVAMNTQLAKRYANHPALALWHVSNEYGGTCHCPLCYAEFRKWLQAKYKTLDALNQAWWTGFWSHTFTAWEEITIIDPTVDGMELDWRRFTTDQTVDFFRAESAPLREFAPDVPVCINTMGFYEGLDYWKFAPHIDVATFDSYPDYHDRPDPESMAADSAMWYDLIRTFKGGKPFLLMESSPGPTNWKPVNRLTRPGVHRVKSLQAVAHGSDSVQYFQIRKGSGGAEKFHGAVIDHVGSEQAPNTRMFQEVAQVGKDLRALAPVIGAATPARAAIISDWESRWAINASGGPTPYAKDSIRHCFFHNRPLWKRGVALDVINGDTALDGYRLVIAPSLYLLRDGFAARVEKFVADGGTFIATWLTGIADEKGLVYQNGYPGPLRKLLGIWAEEIDYLYADESNAIHFEPGNPSGLEGDYTARNICDRIHAETARVAATYTRDFYANEPAVTVNSFGKGEAWYLAADCGHEFLDAFYAKLIERLRLPRALPADQPEGIAAQTRINENGEFTFVTNYSNKESLARLGAAPRTDLLSGSTVSGDVMLPPYGVLVLK